MPMSFFTKIEVQTCVCLCVRAAFVDAQSSASSLQAVWWNILYILDLDKNIFILLLDRISRRQSANHFSKLDIFKLHWLHNNANP